MFQLTAAELARVTRAAATKATNTNFILMLLFYKGENVPVLLPQNMLFIDIKLLCKHSVCQQMQVAIGTDRNNNDKRLCIKVIRHLFNHSLIITGFLQIRIGKMNSFLRFL